jgi:hypothetical protein
MALANYGELKTEIANFLNRDDLTSSIPSFIAMAEASIGRDLRHWRQQRRVTAPLDEQFEDLPIDWLEMVHIYLNDGTELEYASLAEISRRNLLTNSLAGKPKVYTLNSGQIEFVPIPDETYNVIMIYYARIPALVDNDDTSWLLTLNPDVYLYGSLIHSAPFLQEDQRIATWAQLYSAAISNLNAVSDRAEYSGGTLVMRNK